MTRTPCDWRAQPCLRFNENATRQVDLLISDPRQARNNGKLNRKRGGMRHARRGLALEPRRSRCGRRCRDINRMHGDKVDDARIRFRPAIALRHQENFIPDERTFRGRCLLAAFGVLGKPDKIRRLCRRGTHVVTLTDNGPDFRPNRFAPFSDWRVTRTMP